MEGNHILLAKEQTPTNQTSPHMDKKTTKEEIQQKQDQAMPQWQVGLESSPWGKGEGRWAHWEAGRPIGWPTCPWAPPPQSFDVAAPHWMMKSVQEVPCTIPGRARGGSSLYIWGEGLHFKQHTSIKPTHITQAILSRCSSSSLVEILGLEEFGFES